MTEMTRESIRTSIAQMVGVNPSSFLSCMKCHDDSNELYRTLVYEDIDPLEFFVEILRDNTHILFINMFNPKLPNDFRKSLFKYRTLVDFNFKFRESILSIGYGLTDIFSDELDEDDCRAKNYRELIKKVYINIILDCKTLGYGVDLEDDIVETVRYYLKSDWKFYIEDESTLRKYIKELWDEDVDEPGLHVLFSNIESLFDNVYEDKWRIRETAFRVFLIVCSVTYIFWLEYTTRNWKRPSVLIEEFNRYYNTIEGVIKDE